MDMKYSLFILKIEEMKDGNILEKANAENRIIITNDKGFGEMIF